MTKMKRLLSLTLAMALGLSLLAGCSKGDSSSASSQDGSSSSSASKIEPMDLTGVADPYLAASGLAADEVVATIGDYEVTADDLLYWLYYNVSSTLSQYAQFGLTELPWDSEMGDVTMEQSMKDTALQVAAYYRLLPELAAENSLKPDPKVLEALAADHQSVVDEVKDEALAEKAYWANMMTKDQLGKLLQAADLNNQLRDLLFGEGAEGYPTDAEVAAYAEDDLGYYRTKHILLVTKDMETDEDLDEEAKAEKKALADDLLAQLRAAEDPIALFDTLMKEHCEDPGVAANPDGYTAAKGQMVAPYEEAALALKDGEISGIVESDFGYHIILRLPLDLAEFRTALQAQRMNEKCDQWLAEYEVKTTDAYEKLDPSDFWANTQALQLAVYQELDAATGDKE